jgi:hypothetical protein
VSPARVLCRNANDLGVRTCFIAHVENTNGTNLDANTGEHGVFEKNECVYGVTVEAKGVLEVAVIGGVNECGEEHAVQIHTTSFMVNFVLVTASLGNFNDDVVSGHGGLLHGWGEYLITLLDNDSTPATHASHG